MKLKKIKKYVISNYRHENNVCNMALTGKL